MYLWEPWQRENSRKEKVQRTDRDVILIYKLVIPTRKGVAKEKSNRQSKGVARDWCVINIWKNLKDNEAKTWKLALTKVFEDKSPAAKTMKTNRLLSSLLMEMVFIDHQEKWGDSRSKFPRRKELRLPVVTKTLLMTITWCIVARSFGNNTYHNRT